MAKVWVLVLQTVYYDNCGRQDVAHPGDWIEIGKHQARQWLAQGRVQIPKESRLLAVQDFSTCGIVVRADELPDLSMFGDLVGKIEFTAGQPSLPFEHTVIWQPPFGIVPHAVGAGLALLRDPRDGWEMLAMITDEETMASSVGSKGERDKTKAAVGDLRLPVYDTRLLWVRKTEATAALLEAWAQELAAGADEQHSFLRALYGSRVMMYTLAADWQKRRP